MFKRTGKMRKEYTFLKKNGGKEGVSRKGDRSLKGGQKVFLKFEEDYFSSRFAQLAELVERNRKEG